LEDIYQVELFIIGPRRKRLEGGREKEREVITSIESLVDLISPSAEDRVDSCLERVALTQIKC